MFNIPLPSLLRLCVCFAPKIWGLFRPNCQKQKQKPKYLTKKNKNKNKNHSLKAWQRHAKHTRAKFQGLNPQKRRGHWPSERNLGYYASTSLYKGHRYYIMQYEYLRPGPIYTRVRRCIPPLGRFPMVDISTAVGILLSAPKRWALEASRRDAFQRRVVRDGRPLPGCRAIQLGKPPRGRGVIYTERRIRRRTARGFRSVSVLAVSQQQQAVVVPSSESPTRFHREAPNQGPPPLYRTKTTGNC